MAVAFMALDSQPEPEWQVRVDQIEAFRDGGGYTIVHMSSGLDIDSPLSVPEFMLRMQQALVRLDDE